MARTRKRPGMRATRTSDGQTRPRRLTKARLAKLVEEATVDCYDDIVAVCRRGGERQAVRLLDLPLPSPPPAGSEWIAAYRHWSGEG